MWDESRFSEIKQKRSEIIMSKKRSDTPLLQECFAIAGRQNRESVVEWKKRSAALIKTGNGYWSRWRLSSVEEIMVVATENAKRLFGKRE